MEIILQMEIRSNKLNLNCRRYITVMSMEIKGITEKTEFSNLLVLNSFSLHDSNKISCILTIE